MALIVDFLVSSIDLLLIVALVMAEEMGFLTPLPSFLNPPLAPQFAASRTPRCLGDLFWKLLRTPHPDS